MKTTRITKRRVLLNLDAIVAAMSPDGRVQFSSEEDERVIPNTAIRIMDADFEALGRPEVITVTIEPGDLLNVEEVSLVNLPDETLIRATGIYLDGGTFTDCWARPVPSHISGATNDAERLWEVLVFGSTAFGAVTTAERITSYEVLHTEATR